jgi:hypothetical protein
MLNLFQHPVSSSSVGGGPGSALKIRPPIRGRPEKAAGDVGRLVRATRPVCAALLAGGLLRAIPAIAGIEYGP